jgi:hypothetical protein
LGKLLTERTWTLIFFVAFYAILANVPFWTASPLLGLMRNGLFCLEYAAVGLLALFVPRLFSAGLLFAVIAADLICGVSQTFYLSPAECLRNSSFLYLLSGPRLIIVGAVVVLTLLVTAIAASIPVGKITGIHRWIAAGCLVAFSIVSVSVDFVTVVRGTGKVPNPFRLATPGDSVKSSYYSQLWISRLPMIRLVRNEIKSLEVRNLATEAEPTPLASASAAAVGLAGLAGKKSGQEMPNLVVVLLESWGLASDATVRSALAQPYLQPNLVGRYDVHQGTVPFYGATIPGEARELCDSKLGFHLPDATAQDLQSCLPGRLAALGYHNIAVHGMDGHMFNRSTWYSTIGFREEWFRDRFRQLGLQDCVGAFTGTCDAAVAQWIGERLDRQDSSPDFVYWITLNSHLPVPTPAPLPAADSCSITPLLAQQPAFCSWYQLVSNVHHSVAQLAMTELARPTVFVIVGDHAPPFSNPSLRNQFSSEVVPYIVLVPHRRTEPANLARRPAVAGSPSLAHTEIN